jgi:formate-dependent nitrite reductase membrane component NrfD
MIRITLILISIGAISFVLYLLLNRKQNRWTGMSQDEKNRKKIAVAGGTLVFLASLIAAIFMGKKK